MQVKVANYIADWLKVNGIKHVFTVTGGGAMHLNDAFGNHPELKCIYNHHEQASAIAAEGYYKTSGNLPAVCVTSGPGGTNALTGVLGSWLDSSPMIVFSGQVKFECTIHSIPELPLRQFGDQEFNIIDTVKPMTKYAVMVTDGNTIRYHLDKAFFLATHGRPGPVWLDIPLNVQAQIIETDNLREYSPEEDLSEDPLPVSDEVISQVISSIRNSKRPAIIAGAGIRLSKSKNEFDRMIDQLNIPVMTAWNSHDLIENSHRLYAGRPGTLGTRGGNFVFQNCDLLLVIGCRMNLRQIGYAWDQVAPDAYKIMIDIDKAELHKKSFKVDLPIHGNCRNFIEKIIASEYRKDSAENNEWLTWCSAINERYLPVSEAVQGGRMNPYSFFTEMFKLLPENQIVITSNGTSCVIPFQTAEIKKGQRLFTNSGCASMGYGLPAAIGGAIASERPVICIEGDGSLQMNIQELQTVIHNKIPLKIFVVNNSGYHSIRQTQTNFFNAHFAGVDSNSGIGFPQLEKIASAYGFEFHRIEKEDEIKKTIASIIDSDAPVLCELIVDPKQIFAPKSSSKMMPDGKMISAPLHDMFPFLPDAEMEKNKFKSGRC
jgi:acetolactate synthase-1/2/3 large subunit